MGSNLFTVFSHDLIKLEGKTKVTTERIESLWLDYHLRKTIHYS